MWKKIYWKEEKQKKNQKKIKMKNIFFNKNIKNNQLNSKSSL